MIKAAVLGASGYSGQELVTLLCKHPSVKRVDSYTSKHLPPRKPTRVEHHVYPRESLNQTKRGYDVVFMATPTEVSKTYLSHSLACSKTVIDLSGYLRVPTDLFERYYHLEHSHPNELKQSLYGLQPFCQSAYQSQTLISNPGCYPTAILLSLLPLVRADAISKTNLIIDARSGTSGAGKKANEKLMFAEVDGNFFPYKVGHHQHLAELIHVLSSNSDNPITPTFIPQIIPVKRGITLSIYAQLNQGVCVEDVERAYQEQFTDYPLIHVQQINETNDYFMQLSHVTHTPYTHINYKLINHSMLFINTNIDNLLKGAASQAIENMNMLFDLTIDTGLKG